MEFWKGFQALLIASDAPSAPMLAALTRFSTMEDLLSAVPPQPLCLVILFHSELSPRSELLFTAGWEREQVIAVPATTMAEELRPLLLGRMEILRHSILAKALRAASKRDPQAVECARLTHALATVLGLSLALHSQALQIALAPEELPFPWPAGWTTEQILPACAQLALKANLDPELFRPRLREASTALPFRLRTELGEAANLCFTRLWKGSRRAA